MVRMNMYPHTWCLSYILAVSIFYFPSCCDYTLQTRADLKQTRLAVNVL